MLMMACLTEKSRLHKKKKKKERETAVLCGVSAVCSSRVNRRRGVQREAGFTARFFVTKNCTASTFKSTK